MSSSQALYTQIFAKLRTLHPDSHLTRLANWQVEMGALVTLLRHWTISLSGSKRRAK